MAAREPADPIASAFDAWIGAAEHATTAYGRGSKQQDSPEHEMYTDMWLALIPLERRWGGQGGRNFSVAWKTPVAVWSGGWPRGATVAGKPEIQLTVLEYTQEFFMWAHDPPSFFNAAAG